MKRVNRLVFIAMIGAILGFTISFLFSKLGIGEIIDITSTFLNKNALTLVMIFNSILTLLSIIFYLKAKKEVDRGILEDGFIETKYIDYAYATRDAGTFTLLSFLIILYNKAKFSINPLEDVLIITIVLLVFTITKVYLSYLIYKLIKRIEPERKTDPFDFFFDSKFIAESDERDKLRYYKKGYFAFKRMIICQFIIIIILFCSAIYEEISPIIALIVLIPCLVGIFTNGFAGEKND